MKTYFAIFVGVLLVTGQVKAQTYDTNNVNVQTFAGSAFSGYLDGQGQLTMFSGPKSIIADSQSNLFVWDKNNSKVRKISTDATVSTAVTNFGTFSGDFAMAIDHNDTIWGVGGFLTFYNGRSGLFGAPTVYKITGGTIVTSTNLFPIGIGDNTHAFTGICADSSGNLYISDVITDLIYKFSTSGVLSVFVGSGNVGAIDGNGVFTSFNNPAQLACDAADNIYVWDSGNVRIRRINQNRDVVTIAGLHSGNFDGSGTNTGFSSISAMAVDNSGSIYLACGSSIRKMDAATNVTTLAGSFTQSSYTNGAGNLARFNGASGLCLSQGSIFVADANNERIRQISYNPQPQTVSGANLGIGTFAGVTITGTVGRAYQVQSSPDINAWTTRATLLLTASPFLWIDQNPVSGSKFYRAVLLP